MMKSTSIMTSSVHFILTMTVITSVMSQPGGIDGDVLQGDLNEMLNAGVGVKAWQDYFDTLSFTDDFPKGQVLLDQIASKVSSKFKNRIKQVKAVKNLIESHYLEFSSVTNIETCCHVKQTDLTFDERFRTKINTKSACLRNSSTSEERKQYVTQTIVDKFVDNLQRDSTLKWQYFGDENGVLTVFPANDKGGECGSYDPRYRSWYVAATAPTKKEIVIVLDRSGSMAKTHNGQSLMEIAKNATMTVLEALGPDDLVGLVAFSSDAQTASGCYSESTASANPPNIKKLKDYIKSLEAGGLRHYILALEKAFGLLQNSSHMDAPNETREKVILFLTNGSPTEPEDHIMNVIRIKNAALSNKVTILTYSLGEVAAANARAILTKMAEQTTYDRSKGPVQKGHYSSVEDPSMLRRSMASYYNFLSKAEDGRKPAISVPYLDAFGLGMVITISVPVYHTSKLIGVAGFDVTLGDLFADAIFNHHYIFVTNTRGHTIWHPLLPQPDNVAEDPIIAKIQLLEPNPKAATVLNSMKSGGSGTESFISDHIITNGNSFRDGVTIYKLPSTYYWKAIEGTDYSVCLVVPNGTIEPQIFGLPPTDKFLYHRLDIRPPSETCKHFNRLATKETSVVKLSPDCFINPYLYLNQIETAASVAAIAVFLSHKSNKNPGLKSDVGDTVSMLARADRIWLDQLIKMAQYAVRRYIGTYNGVFRVVPGVKMGKKFNPVDRLWYKRAIAYPGKGVFSAPYLDAFGAGFVVTLSYTLFKGNLNNTHKPSDTVLAVAGADFPTGYIYQTFIGKLSSCSKAKHSCFLINTSGYVVIHKDFIEAKLAVLPEVEDVHVTVKEQLLAKRMIENNYMVRKKCLYVAEMRDQSSWEVDLGNESSVELKYPSGLSYVVSTVPGSNVFLVVKHWEQASVNQGCSCGEKSANSFRNYSCQQKDGPNTCECPCFLPANYQFCKDLFPASSVNPPCTPEPPSLNVTPLSQSEKDAAENLPFCYQTSCKYHEKSVCMSSLGCSWCARARDGGMLKKAYCALEEECYLGVVGMPSPYAPAPDPTERMDPRIEAILGGLAAVVLIALTYIIWRKCQKKTNRTTSTVPNTEDSRSGTSPLPNKQSPSSPVSKSATYSPSNTGTESYLTNEPQVDVVGSESRLQKDLVEQDCDEIDITAPDPPASSATCPDHRLTGINHHLPPLPVPVPEPPPYDTVVPPDK